MSRAFFLPAGHAAVGETAREPAIIHAVKFLPILALSLAALAGCSKYAVNSEGGSALNRTRLYDFRSGDSTPPPGADRSAKLEPSLAAASSACPNAGNTRRASSSAKVLGETTGAFSAAAAENETALLLSTPGCEEGATPSSQVVIVPASGEARIIARAEVPDRRLLQSFDLNHDGQAELFLARETRENGVARVEAHIYQFDKGKLRTVEDFGNVYENDCQSTLQAQGMTAAVIDYIPRTARDAMPSFVVQLYRADCPGQGQAPQWRLVSSR
jgi:hypothetical protein